MLHALRRLKAGLLACLLLASCLGGCGDNEPEQRKAFIETLDRKVIGQKDRIALLTQDEQDALGPYAAHFDLLVSSIREVHGLNLASGTNRMRQQICRMLQSPEPGPWSEMLAEAAATREEVRKEIEAALDSIQRKRAALKQPEDLWTVYTEALDRHIVTPLGIVLDALEAGQPLMDACREFGEFLEANRDRLNLTGSGFLLEDGSLEPDLDRLIDKLEAAYDEYRQALDRALDSLNRPDHSGRDQTTPPISAL